VTARRLVGRDPDPVPGGLQAVDGAERVRIEVIGTQVAVALLEGRLLLAPLGLLDELEEAAPVLRLVRVGDRASQHGHEREVGHPEDLGPGMEDARLIDEGLAHVEDNPALTCHGTDASRGNSVGAAQRRLSRRTRVRRPLVNGSVVIGVAQRR
jgi:hypothetical protein